MNQKSAQNESLLRILIVEDDQSARAYLTHMLPDTGTEIDFAIDGLTGVIEYSKRPYDLVIIDWSMPYMTGGEFVRRIDALTKKGILVRSKRSTKFLIFSSMQRLNLNIPRTEHLNFLGFLSKSQSPLKIKNTLEKYTNKILNELTHR